MKPNILLLHLLSSALTLATATSHHQHALTKTIPTSSTEQHVVPGHNRASYGPIPWAEQIFHIAFLEIAPTPIPVSQIFFVFIRGWIPTDTSQNLHLTPAHLASATLSITMSAVLEKANHKGKIEPVTITIPLETRELAEGCHLGIRNGTGDYTQHLTLEDRNDILTDYWLPGPFLETGNYTFEVVANLGGGKGCLFALTLTQWLEGRPGW